MYQKLLIVGHLGGDPTLRYTPAGSPCCTFSVATNRKYKSSTDGERVEEVTWFRVTAWGSLGERCNEFLAKGRQVLVEGRLQPDRTTGHPRIWTGNDGAARAGYEVRADQVRFLGGGREATEEEEAELGDLPF